MVRHRDPGLDAEAKISVDPHQQVSEWVGDFVPREGVRRDLALQSENREVYFPCKLVALLDIIAVNAPADRQTETQCAGADFGIAERRKIGHGGAPLSDIVRLHSLIRVSIKMGRHLTDRP
jgi:hypothetical protein